MTTIKEHKGDPEETRGLMCHRINKKEKTAEVKHPNESSRLLMSFHNLELELTRAVVVKNQAKTTTAAEAPESYRSQLASFAGFLQEILAASYYYHAILHLDS